MEDRGGNIELLLPYATIEPIRGVLLQMFMGEKFGRDPIWEGHFATEINQAEISVDAVLYEADIPLKQLMRLKVGDTLPLDMRADARHRALRRRHPDRGADGPGRRPRRDTRHEAPAQAKYDTSRCSRRSDEQNKMMEAP